MMLNDRQSILVGQNLKRIPRGEMWLGRRLFQDMGWEDDLEARQRLCRDLAMDIVFLPVDFAAHHNLLFDYRYFSLDEVRQFVAENNSPLVSVVVDGSLQRLAGKIGLEALLHDWHTERAHSALKEESVRVGEVITACLECKPDVLVIADDIAYSRSTYVNPSDLKQTLFVFYEDWVRQAHARNTLALFHSDGNLTSILPGLVGCGFDGLAGCELDCQDVPSLTRQFGSQLTFLTGIVSDLLDEELGPSHRKRFVQAVSTLAAAGRFMLCSSSGLSSAKHLSNLRTLYQWADEAWHSNATPRILQPDSYRFVSDQPKPAYQSSYLSEVCRLLLNDNIHD